jgi:hypothetical protein
VGAEVAAGGFGAIGADAVELRCVRLECLLARGVGPGVHQGEHGLGPLLGSDGQEYPAAFAAPLHDSRIGKDANVARNARLTLIQDDRKLSDRELHPAQKRENPQSRRVGEGL